MELRRAAFASRVAGAGRGFGLSRLRSVEESALWPPNPVLAPQRPQEPDPSHSTTFSVPPAPPNCSPVSNPSAPQPPATMHVIKRGERPGRGRRVSGEQVKGSRAAAVLAVGLAHLPLPLPALPAAASRSVKTSRPPACVSLSLPPPSRPSVGAPSALSSCRLLKEQYLPFLE